MSHNHTDQNFAGNLAGLTPRECLRLLFEHRQKWILPTIACGALALVYALFMSRYWEASQGLMVRPEATASSTTEVGKFADLYQMRTFQETILEVAKSSQVIVAALQAVEQAETDENPTEPTAEDIEKMRERLSLLPPGGAEFGKTEVCYLQVKDTKRERALKLVAEFGQQIDKRLHSLRTEKSRSLSKEIEQQVARAKAALEVETSRLAEFESQVGADLGELRMLNASYSGQSDLRQQAIRLNDERRAAELASREAEQLLSVLKAARNEPEQLIAMPSTLLVSQPTLRRLKDGLVDAQLRAARLEGTRTADHPQVQAAIASVEFIRKDLHNELKVAIRGVQVEKELNANRATKLQQQYEGVQQRLANLAKLRAGYENRMSAVENSRGVLDQAQKQLGEVQARLVADSGSQLVTPIDQPETGPYPGGPGRATVVLVGTFGGFALGMGWLFLTVVPTTPSEESAESIPASQSEAVPAVEPIAESPVATPEPAAAFSVPPAPRDVSSNLPPAVAAKIAEIVAAREASVPQETCV